MFYRDKRGREPVNDFLEELLEVQPLTVAKIDDAIEEHLNGRDPRHPPPEFPATSQIEGELRELRVRFAKTRYRVLSAFSEPDGSAPRLREEHWCGHGERQGDSRGANG